MSFLTIPSRSQTLGHFPIRRVLPYAKKRMVGPFIFLDHMGPYLPTPSDRMDVQLHPHIGLSTLTYLFEGHIHHQDSLGSSQNINPGEVNWMTAGSGISHTERSLEEDIIHKTQLHGLQFWVALPDAVEDQDPQFVHYKKNQIPQIQQNECTIDVVVGSFAGETSPVEVTSPTLFVHYFSRHSHELNYSTKDFEIGIYLIEGTLGCEGQVFQNNELLVFSEQNEIKLHIGANSRVAIIGGKAFPKEKNIWWNFVSSTKEKINQARINWNAGNFPMVAGEKHRLLAPEGRLNQ